MTEAGPRHTRFARVRTQLEAYTPAPGWPSWLHEFALFTFKQGWACLFGALMLALLLATHLLYPADAPLARYDFLTLAALAIQLGMLAFRLETLDEAKVILAFHVVGTVMELFNLGTFARAWAYPGQEDGWEPVSPAKLGAWYLLMYISFVLVASLHGARPREREEDGA